MRLAQTILWAVIAAAALVEAIAAIAARVTVYVYKEEE